MDQIARWHPGSNPVARRWALAPSLLPDEILSSWLCRCALALGTEPVRFTAALWARSRAWSGDFDRDPKETRLRTLAAESGFPLADLERAALKRWARRWMGDAAPSRRAWPWLVPIGARGIARTGIAQFCPHCWREDAAPYYRLPWRLSWYVACERHGTLLLDRCPVCAGAPAPHRLPLGAQHLAQCDRCGSDLREAPAGAPAPASALTLQAAAAAALLRGEARWWSSSLGTASWLATLRYWVGLLRQGLREGASPAATLARDIAPDLQSSALRGTFDALPTAARATLLAAAGAIAELGDRAALRLAKRCGLTQRHCSPWTLAVEEAKAWAQRLPDGRLRRKARANARRRCRYGIGHPRPRHEVEGMYRRLLREAGLAT
ncbi:MAG: TniQ family protein [Vulcanimicrobiaceae bacterium]